VSCTPIFEGVVKFGGEEVVAPPDGPNPAFAGLGFILNSSSIARVRLGSIDLDRSLIALLFDELFCISADDGLLCRLSSSILFI